MDKKTEAEYMEEMWAELAQLERQVFWQFIRLLLFPKYDDGSGMKEAIVTDNSPHWRYAYLHRYLCLLAMLFGRKRPRKGKGCYDELAWCNYNGDGYGYSMDTLSYNSKLFRYEISRDGESTY